MHSLRTIRTLVHAAALASGVLVLQASEAPCALRLWPNAVSGSASTASNWSPAIVPTSADDGSFQTAGSYTVTWASPQDTLAYLHAIVGTPAFSISGTLGVGNIFSLSNNGRVTVTSGRVRANMIVVGGTGFGRLIVTGAGSQIVARSANAATMFAETTATSASLHVLAEGQFLSNGWMEFGRKSASTCSVTVNGGNLITRVGSKLGTLTTGAGQRGNVILSPFGTTRMDISNGGVLEVKGHLVVGQRGLAVLREIDTTPLLDPLITVNGITFVGYESSALTAGRGTLSIEGGTARLGGGIWLGDPDHTAGNADFGTLTMRGGTAIVGGSIVMPASLAGSIETVGGTLQLLAGATTLRQSTPFDISSGAGSPTVMVNGSANLTVNTAGGSPFAIGVGRGGAGRLRIAGAAAAVTSTASTAIADSAGGTGVVEVDSSAVFLGRGDLEIGPGGQLSVSNGGQFLLSPSPVAPTPAISSRGAIALHQGAITTTTGTLHIPGVLTGNGTLDGDWLNLSSIVIPPAETLSVLGSLTQLGGTVSGNGTLRVDGDVLQTTGVVQANVLCSAELIPYDPNLVRPRADPGAVVPGRPAGVRRPSAVADSIDTPLGHLHITGDFVPSGVVQVRIGSQSDGLRDTIEVDGAASLGGALHLTKLPSAGTPGDTVTVLEAGSVTGSFSVVLLDGQAPDSTVQILYTPTAVKVVFAAATTGVDDGPNMGAAPAALRFSARRIRGSMAFVLDLPMPSRVRLALYDVSGREVARLADAALAVGRHEFPCDQALASGMYFARAQIDTGSGRVVRTARAAVLR